MRGFILAAALLLGAAAFGADGSAQEERHAATRRTVLHFGEDDIRGGITRPDGELVQAPKREREDSLLRVRRSFNDRALGASIR